MRKIENACAGVRMIQLHTSPGPVCRHPASVCCCCVCCVRAKPACVGGSTLGNVLLWLVAKNPRATTRETTVLVIKSEQLFSNTKANTAQPFAFCQVFGFLPPPTSGPSVRYSWLRACGKLSRNVVWVSFYHSVIQHNVLTGKCGGTRSKTCIACSCC